MASWSPENIKKAVMKSAKKDANEINKLQGMGKKNAKPEKEVEKLCMAWMRSHGWDVNIYEAKNIRDSKGNFHASNMPSGVSDCMGITPSGQPVYVEFKAPGQRSTFNQNPKQQKFLIKKIYFYAFACVTDSVERLEYLFNQWQTEVRFNGKNAGREFLLNALPQKKKALKDFS